MFLLDFERSIALALQAFDRARRKSFART